MVWRAMGDWGTSRLRLYRVENGQVIAETERPGIGLSQTPPAEILQSALTLLGTDRPEAIYLCGMAGSRSGLAEAPYAECPADAPKWRAAALRLSFEDVPLCIAAGVASKWDVMRGEETQIFGARALDPALGDVLLPGTHSKWVRMDGGAIVALHTFMTGELYALLRGRSTLASGVSGEAADEETGFAQGLDRGLAGYGLAGSLFAARVEQLRQGRSGRWASGYLSGLLIGDEVAAMQKKDLLPLAITVIGAGALVDRYAQALVRCGTMVRRLDGQACALKGLELLDADNK